jgi:hypothetical protein
MSKTYLACAIRPQKPERSGTRPGQLRRIVVSARRTLNLTLLTEPRKMPKHVPAGSNRLRSLMATMIGHEHEPETFQKLSGDLRVIYGDM